VGAGAVLRLQDAGLDVDAVGRQVGEGGAHADEEVGDGPRAAAGEEDGRLDVDGRVAVEVGPGQRAHDQVLDQVRDAQGREGLVADADAEDERGGGALRSGSGEHGDAVDLGALHGVMVGPRRCGGGRTRQPVADGAPAPPGPPPGDRRSASVPRVTQPPAPDPAALAASAAEALTAALGGPHDVAVVMGSGWAPAADAFGPAEASVAIGDLPGFAAPTAIGHGGEVRSVRVGERRVLLFLGRTHLYEGRGVEPVVHGVRTAAAAGVRTVVLTNAAGGLGEEHRVGQAVVIADHLNLTARSPLVGATFVDLTDLYTARLRDLARDVDPALTEGVYAALPGPHYETPAEIRMLRTMGADLVGMSTALEAIAARAAGMEVFGLSMVTNAAAGMTGEVLDHREVLAAGQAAAGRLGQFLVEFIGRLP
jgi:purine-nucleoside phosphorylase